MRSDNRIRLLERWPRVSQMARNRRGMLQHTLRLAHPIYNIFRQAISPFWYSRFAAPSRRLENMDEYKADESRHGPPTEGVRQGAYAVSQGPAIDNTCWKCHCRDGNMVPSWSHWYSWAITLSLLAGELPRFPKGFKGKFQACRIHLLCHHHGVRPVRSLYP